jgi:hypothetical protein
VGGLRRAVVVFVVYANGFVYSIVVDIDAGGTVVVTMESDVSRIGPTVDLLGLVWFSAAVVGGSSAVSFLGFWLEIDLTGCPPLQTCDGRLF